MLYQNLDLNEFAGLTHNKFKLKELEFANKTITN